MVAMLYLLDQCSKETKRMMLQGKVFLRGDCRKRNRVVELFFLALLPAKWDFWLSLNTTSVQCNKTREESKYCMQVMVSPKPEIFAYLPGPSPAQSKKFSADHSPLWGAGTFALNSFAFSLSIRIQKVCGKILALLSSCVIYFFCSSGVELICAFTSYRKRFYML